MRRCASRKKSPESITSAARLKASLWRRIAPRTERSASRLCGSVRSATPSGMRCSAEPSGPPTKASLKARTTFRQLPLRLGAFRDHLHGHRYRDFAMQLHRHLQLAHLLDWFGELQLALVDVESLGVDSLDDVGGGYRAVQRVGLPDPAGNHDFDSG